MPRRSTSSCGRSDAVTAGRGLSPRQRAYLQPAPAGWIPAEGEWVYLPRTTPPDLGNVVRRGRVLVYVPPGWCRVEVRWGRRCHVRVYRVRELRPVQTPAPEDRGRG